MQLHRTTIRCGNTLHVLVASTPAELASMAARTEASLLRANGHAVVHADGRSVHVTDEELHPTVWHRDGNRVRARRVRYERASDGSTTSSVVRMVWVSAGW